MENRYFRRTVRYGHRLFPAYQGSQRPRFHDAGGQGLDQNQHTRHHRGMSGRIHDNHAIAARHAGERPESNRPDGHLCPRHGIRGQRSRELYRGTAFRSRLLSRLHGERHGGCARFSDGFAQRTSEYTNRISHRCGCDYGTLARHIEKSTQRHQNGNRIRQPEQRRRNVRFLASCTTAGTLGAFGFFMDTACNALPYPALVQP